MDALPGLSDLDQLYVALMDYEFYTREGQDSAGTIMQRLGGTKDQADELDDALCDMERASSEATGSPEEGLDEDWDAAEVKLKAVLDTVLGADGYDYEECSLYFPVEQWEEGLEERREEMEED